MVSVLWNRALRAVLIAKKRAGSSRSLSVPSLCFQRFIAIWLDKPFLMAIIQTLMKLDFLRLSFGFTAKWIQ